MVPKFATYYENRKKQFLDCSVEPSKTLQSDAEAADINHIMKRYEKHGILPELIKQNPRYGDFSDVPTYQEALDIVELAHTQFANLDAEIRKRFSNDPAEFLAFTNDPANIREMVKMGLAIENVPQAELAVNKPKEEMKS